MDKVGKRRPTEWENDETRDGKGRRHWPVTLCFSELRSIDAVQHRTERSWVKQFVQLASGFDLKKRINKYAYICVYVYVYTRCSVATGGHKSKG